MGISKEQDILKSALEATAEHMIMAAKTAPKGRGADNLVYTIVKNDRGIKKIAARMKEIGEQYGQGAFVINAASILSCSVIVLLGTRIKSLGLKKCGYCGFENCAEKDRHPDIPCAFNSGDLGIAVGSAVTVAMDRRVDNRIMYTIGLAVLELGLLPPEVKIVYGIPLSAASKNIFFDRK